MLIIEKKLVLGEGMAKGIKDSTGTAEENLVLALVNQIQNFA